MFSCYVLCPQPKDIRTCYVFMDYTSISCSHILGMRWKNRGLWDSPGHVKRSRNTLINLQIEVGCAPDIKVGLLAAYTKPSTNTHTHSIGPKRNYQRADSKNTHKKRKRALKMNPQATLGPYVWHPQYRPNKGVSALWLPANAEYSNLHDRKGSIVKWSHLARQSSRPVDRLLWHQTIHWSRHTGTSSLVAFIFLIDLRLELCFSNPCKIVCTCSF